MPKTRGGKAPYVRRLKKEFEAILTEPPPYITARPDPNNILSWHFLFDCSGLEGPYEGGLYHGMLKFPPTYPFAPPEIYMLTPNGRFEAGRSKPVCTTMSSYHPETWQPAWSVASILTGLLSFMQEDTITAGSLSTSVANRRNLAAASKYYNLKQGTPPPP